MKLTDFDFPPEQAAGLVRLLEKMGVSAAASRESSDICRRTFGVEIKSTSVETRSVEVIASTAALDSYDEIVEQDWQLERYRSNPVVLYAHNAVGLCGPAEDTLPIGFASDVGLQSGQLCARLHFVDEKANPMAERVWQGFKQGSLRAVSVGFRPHATNEETRDDKKILHLSQNELFEISVCPIPANPEAVARSAERNRAQAIRLADKTQQGTNNMDAEQITALEATVAEAKAAVDTANAKIVELTERAEKAEKSQIEAETRATSAEERAKAAEAEVNALEVKALVGVKLLPSEVEDFTVLRASNRKLFDSMISKRQDLPHLKGDVLPAEEQKNSATTVPGSDDLVSLATSETNSTGEDLASLAAVH